MQRRRVPRQDIATSRAIASELRDSVQSLIRCQQFRPPYTSSYPAPMHGRTSPMTAIIRCLTAQERHSDYSTSRHRRTRHPDPHDLQSSASVPLAANHQSQSNFSRIANRFCMSPSHRRGMLCVSPNDSIGSFSDPLLGIAYRCCRLPRNPRSLGALRGEEATDQRYRGYHRGLGLTCTCARFAEDIRNVVNDLKPDGIRVLPIAGRRRPAEPRRRVCSSRASTWAVVDEDNLCC